MKKTRLLFIFFLLVVSFSLLAYPKDSVVANDVVQVIGLTETVDGKTYSDLDELATKWIFPADFSKTPLDDADGSRSIIGLQPLATIVILASNLGGTSTRSLTIPANRYVFFQLIGSTNWYFTNDPCNPDYKPASGQSAVDFLSVDIELTLNGVKNMVAQLDGKNLVTDLKKYKVITKPFGLIPPKDFLDPACDYANQVAVAVDSSYALLLKIPKGNHVLTYKADLSDTSNLRTELTWHLTVE